MVGKLTNDHEMSCSILAAAAGYSKWQTRNETLGNMINAKNGNDVRTPQTAIMRRGDLLEPMILMTASEELGMASCEIDITEPVRHKDIPLQGSLDGLCYTPEAGLTIKQDEEKGIYVMTDNKEITIKGKGVMECKVTSVFEEDEPPLSRGPMQAQGLMDIVGASYCVIAIMYRSIFWRYFIYPVDVDMVKEIHDLVKDMDRRVKSEEYFPPSSAQDAANLHSEVIEEPMELPESNQDYIDLYLHAKKSIKHWENIRDEAQLNLMETLQDHKTGYIDSGETRYVVTWGTTNHKPQPVKITPAKEGYTSRNKTIKIKELNNEN